LLSRGTKEYLGGEAIPFSITAKKALENALREALSLGHNYIGTEHLLLSLIRMPQDLADEKLSAWGILNELEINENEIRQYIISGLSATSKIASERYIKWAIEIIRISEELLILEREIKRDGFSGNSFDEARTHLNNIKKFLTTRIGESILSDHK
jgi:ATP-dependent Clp protease ATP-binding subunit ClpA